MDHFVYYGEVVLFQRQNVLPLAVIHVSKLVHRKVSLYTVIRESFIRGSTVHV